MSPMTASTAMQVESHEINPCTVELTVRCAPEQVRTGYEKAYRRAAKRVKVPGFRPGTAPKAILRNYVNADAVKDFAAQEIVSDAYQQAVKDQQLTPQSGPKIELIKLEEESGECEFKAKVPLEPKIELGDYNGLEAIQPGAEVTDQELEDQIQSLRERRATRKKVENRGAESGDLGVISIEPVGEEGKGASFMSVVGQTFPQLDQLLMGMKAEDAKLEDLTFPQDFQEKEWAGKPLKCQVTLRSLSAPELPELTEDFAKQFKTESVEELKARVRDEMSKAKKNWVQDYVNEQLLEELLKKSTIHVADNLWENIADQRMREIAEDAAKEGKTLQSVAETANMTVDQLRERFRHEALLQVKRAVAIKEIFKKEDMKLSKEEIGAQIEQLAHESGLSPQEAFRALKQSGNLGEVEFRAMFDRVLSLLREKGKLTPASAEPK